MRRSARSLASALAVAAIAALSAPAAASAAAKGMDTDLTWGTSSSTQQQTVATLQDAGATWTRLTISWHDVETSPGQYNASTLAAVDNAVSLARARGINVDIDVLAAPGWETGSSNQYAPPARTADYANFIRAMATRYRGQVAAWEIWNEENISRFWATGANAAQYAALLQAAYPAVKAGDPNALVVFGGTASNDYNFLAAAYAAMPNLGSYYDVMATHPYTNNDPPDLTLRANDGRIATDSFDGYREVRQTMLSHGDNKPIWFTEFGWSTYTGGVDAATQARDVTLAYECMQQDSYVQVAFYYNLRNNYWANDAQTWDDQLGLLTTSWTQKPAYASYKAYVPGTGGCAYRESGGGVQGISPGGGSGGGGSSGPGTSPVAPPVGGGPRVVVHVGRRRHHHGLSVAGRVVGASAGRVVLEVERRSHGHWSAVRRISVAVAGDGSFRRLIRITRRGRMRVRVIAGPGIRAATAGVTA